MPIAPIVLGGITKNVPYIAKCPLGGKTPLAENCCLNHSSGGMDLGSIPPELLPEPQLWRNGSQVHLGSYSPEPALGSWEALQSLGDPC